MTINKCTKYSYCSVYPDIKLQVKYCVCIHNFALYLPMSTTRRRSHKALNQSQTCHRMELNAATAHISGFVLLLFIVIVMMVVTTMLKLPLHEHSSE